MSRKQVRDLIINLRKSTPSSILGNAPNFRSQTSDRPALCSDSIFRRQAYTGDIKQMYSYLPNISLRQETTVSPQTSPSGPITKYPRRTALNKTDTHSIAPQRQPQTAKRHVTKNKSESQTPLVPALEINSVYLDPMQTTSPSIMNPVTSDENACETKTRIMSASYDHNGSRGPDNYPFRYLTLGGQPPPLEQVINRNIWGSQTAQHSYSTLMPPTYGPTQPLVSPAVQNLTAAAISFFITLLPFLNTPAPIATHPLASLVHITPSFSLPTHHP